MTEEQLIRQTIDLCADIATNGLVVEETHYGKEALLKLSQHPETTAKFVMELFHAKNSVATAD